MKRYRICCLDSDERITSEHKIECRDDLEAMEKGETLCAKNAVEVWDGSRFVARFKAGTAPLTHEDHQSL